MMNEERRSGRPRKPVSYPGCDLSDDDFADTTPPPPKKQKAEKKPSKKASKDTAPILDISSSSLRSKKARLPGNEESVARCTRGSRRKPPEEKAFDRELEQALQISLLETSGCVDLTAGDTDPLQPPPLSPVANHRDTTDLTSRAGPPPLITPDIHSPVGPARSPVPPAHRCSTQVDVHTVLPGDVGKNKGNTSVEGSACNPSRTKTNCAPFLTRGEVVMDETIQVVGSPVIVGSPSEEEVVKRGRRRPRKVIIESDEEDGEASDFVPEAEGEEPSEDEADEESEESDQPDSDDSDFAPKGRPKKKLSTSKKENISAKRKTESKLKVDIVKEKPSNIILEAKSSKTAVPATSVPAPATQPAPTRTNVRIVPLAPAKTNLVTARSQPATSRLKPSRPSSTPATPTPTLNKVSPKPCSTPSPRVSHSQHCSPLTAQWKPPGKSQGNTTSGGSTLKSPSSGLRLGLSRNMKVKPLHSSVKVT